MREIVCRRKSFDREKDMYEWVMSAYSFAEKTDGRFTVQSRQVDELSAEVKIFENEFTKNT